MKKADRILGLAVLIVCLVLFLMQFFFRREGTAVIIEVDGQVYGTYDLYEDKEIAVGSTNCVRIENGTAKMTEADCPDHLCIKQGEISADGQMIVCLPNRVTVRIVSESHGMADVPDAVAG